VDPQSNQKSPAKPQRSPLLSRVLLSLCAALVLAIPSLLAQDQDPPQPAGGSQTARVTVRGVVLNAATNQPLPRALVHFEGDADTGTLTDSEGIFEIPGVPTGPQTFEIVKPGFYDRLAVGSQSTSATANHNVLVDAEMPKLTLSLAPASAIQGRIELSTGDPAAGITVNLLRRTVMGGRAAWPQFKTTITNSEGNFRFAALTDGQYVLKADPLLESDSNLAPVANQGAIERTGYPAVFYPAVRDFSSAQKFYLSAGQQAQANFTLALVPFHAVTIKFSLPPKNNLSIQSWLRDDTGFFWPNSSSMNSVGESLQETQYFLPDGSYSLNIFSQLNIVRKKTPGEVDNSTVTGRSNFIVDGHPISNLLVPISLEGASSNPIELVINRTTPTPPQSNASTVKSSVAEVLISPSDGRTSESDPNGFAGAVESGPMFSIFSYPNSYWVHTHPGKGLCESSFTAAGTSLAREPLLLTLSGPASPSQLVLRDDCAKLTLSLPAQLSALYPGEEPSYTVYVVPDFDSTVDLAPATLRPSTGGTITLEDLTPGSYHVYAFDAPVEFEYRNPASLPSAGQPITLSPGTTGNLVLEVAKP